MSVEAIWQIPERGAARWPDRVAAIDRDRTVSYAELDRRSRTLAAALAEHGIGRGERVALLLENSVAFLESYFALARIGAITVPLGTRQSAEEIGYLTSQSGARAVLHAADLSQKLAQTETRTERLVWEQVERLIGRADPERLPRPPGPEAAAAIFYTSGSTGDPKGVLLTHGGIAHCLSVTAEAYGYGDGDVALCQLPLTHTNVHFLPFPILHTGGKVVLEQRFRPGPTLELIERHAVTVYISVTSTAMLVVKHAEMLDRPLRLTSVRKLLTGGSPVPSRLKRDLLQLMPNSTMVNCYGMTETGSAVSRMDPDEMEPREGSVGLPYRGIEVRVRGGGEEPGEIELRSPSVMAGYWENPTATAEVLVDGWLRTGDMGHIDEYGYLWLSGRRKHRIKRGGETLFPGEIETVLAEYPGVKETVVVPRSDEVMGDRVVALIAMQPGWEFDPDAVIRLCRERLADYKVPEFLAEIRPELPKNGVGKVDTAGLERDVESGTIAVLDYRRGRFAKK